MYSHTNSGRHHNVFLYGEFMKKLLLMLLLCPSIALAGTPTFKICAKGNSITAKQKCSRGETILDMQTLQGMQTQTDKLANCRAVTANCIAAPATCCELKCNDGEYLLQHAGNSDGTANLWSLFPSSTYTSNGLFASIRYCFYVPFGSSDPDSNVTVYGTCCPR